MEESHNNKVFSNIPSWFSSLNTKLSIFMQQSGIGTAFPHIMMLKTRIL